MVGKVSNYAVLQALAAVISDATELFKAEIELAKVEIASGISVKVQAMIWLGVVAVFAIVALTVAAAGVALAISTGGLSLHWACFIVAGGIALLAVIALVIARGLLAQDISPTRTMNQIEKDITIVREKL